MTERTLAMEKEDGDKTIDAREKHPYVQETQNAIEKLIKSGRSKASPDFTDTCNKLLHFNYYSEQGRMKIIENLSKMNGNFVAKIILKGLSSLGKVYTDPKTLEDESIKLVELCVELYEKQCTEGQNWTSPSPAMVIDCAFEFSNELLKSRDGSDLPIQTLMSKCLFHWVEICETVLRNNLVFVLTSEVPVLTRLFSKDVCKFLLEVLKPKIVDESFEEVLHQTAKIAKRDVKLNILNGKISDGQIVAELLQTWAKLLEFPFMTNWCAVSIAKNDFLLNDEEYAASLQYSNASTYLESLIWLTYLELKTLSSKNSTYELPSDKKRFQIFFDHAEIMLRHTTISFQLLHSNVPNNNIEEVFEILGIQLHREWLPQMTVDQSKQYEKIMKESLIYRQSGLRRETLNAMRLKLEQEQYSASLQIRLRLQLIVSVIADVLLALPNQEPVIKILRFWRQHFSDEHYDALFLLCAPLAVTVRLNQNEPQRNVEKLVEFVYQFPKHLIQSVSNWTSALVSLMIAFPNSWNSNGNFINQFVDKCSESASFNGASEEKMVVILQFVRGNLASNTATETIKAEVLKLIWELYDSIPKAIEYELALNGAIHVLPSYKAEAAKRYLLDFVDAVGGKNLERKSYSDACSVLHVIQMSSITEKTEVFGCYLQLLEKTSKENMIEVIQDSLALMTLPINAANAVRLLELIGKKDRGSCFLIAHCANNLKNHGDDFVNELIVFLLIVVERTLRSNEDRDKFAAIATRYIQMITETTRDVEVCKVLLACIAGSIAVNTFDEDGNDFSLRLVCLYLVNRKTESRITTVDILNLYVELFLAYHQVRSLAAGNKDFINSFIGGATDMLLLPLPLIRILSLVTIIIEILTQGNFNGCEVAFIMLHLFHSPNIISSDVDQEGLSLHFAKVVTLPIAQDLSMMTFTSKQSVIDGDEIAMHKDTEVTSLMKLLLELTPLAFAQRESSDLFKFVIKRLKKSSMSLYSSMFILSMAKVSINQNVTAKQFRKEFKELQKEMGSIPQMEITPLVLGCMTEYHCLNVNQGIKNLVPLLLERNWNQDSQFIVEIMVSYLNVPQQIVLAFHEAKGIAKKKHAIQRVLDILHQVHPTIVHGTFLDINGDESTNNEVLQALASRDFRMLTRNNSLTPKDVSTILLVYTIKEVSNHIALFKSEKSSSTKLSECSSNYEKSEPLTPGKLGFLILHHLRTLNIEKDILERECLVITSELLRKDCFLPLTTTFQEYIEVFVQIMKSSCSLDEMKKYFQLSVQHAIECKEVLLAAYSWNAGRKSREESSRMIQKVLHMVETLVNGSCQRACLLKKILEIVEDEEVTDNLFKLLDVSISCTTACLDSILEWSKTESIALVTKVKERYEKLKPNEIQRTDVCLQILPFVSKAFPNCPEKVGHFLDDIIDNQVLDDPLSLGRIPTWFNLMIAVLDAEGSPKFSRSDIESWCTSLLHYGKLSSSDVDAITNLTPQTTETISKESGQILECLFNAPAPQTWEDVNIDTEALKQSVDSFKRCLQFAKILNEFASIAMQLKENDQVLQNIKDGTHDLCSSFSQTSNSSELFKKRDRIFKALFGLVFSGEVGISKESISRLNCQKDLSKSLIADFRRLARSVFRRPVTFGYVKDVVQQTLSIVANPENNEASCEEVQNDIHKHVIGLEPNQDAIHTLQAVGYNQGSLDEDLWYSASIQIEAYVPLVESLLEYRLEGMLKQTLMEWRGILSDLKIEEIQVNGVSFKVKDLMDFSDSLETVKLKLEAVKHATQNAPPDHWSNTRRKHLIQKEKFAKNTIAKQTQQKTEENDEKQAGKLAKMTIVWDNRAIASTSMKTCSEKIPGCYAPNGFHSEKPVICRLAVDNKILTLYKQDKGDSLTELENVEVKLFPAGMLVYEIYSSSHCYDTDQLWAAFFKMLLLKQLVPKIFLTNVSPGFQWIAKNQFVPTVSSPPEGITFCSCNTLIPTTEDSYDYEPNISLHRLHSELSNHQMEELIILTPDNVKKVELCNLKSPKRDQLVRRLMENVSESVENSSRFLEMHPEQETRKILTKRLTFAIRKASEDSVDKEIPDLETVSAYIVMRKLSSKHKGDTSSLRKVEENGKDFYGQIILDALHNEMDGHAEYNREYDCCEHVQFNSFTI